ncbi:MAG: ABC transporter ATP-binding protein [Thermoleophilaceae bacterium]|nr:ABC transporter ATP-binding protein [Thermoleophilaceae bacterium]
MLYTLKAAEKRYGEGATEVIAVAPTNLRLDAGEYVAIVGPSGSGKTTMLQLLGALDRPSAGEILFEGDQLARMGDSGLATLRRTTIGFIFQQFNLIPTLDARQNVEVALAPARPPGAERRRRADELLAQVGLAARTHHLPSELSGGEQQRVAIARALANEPRVLLADEPTGNLDSATGEEVMESVERLWREHGLTVILVTHDRQIAERAPRVIEMRDGSVVRS